MACGVAHGAAYGVAYSVLYGVACIVSCVLRVLCVLFSLVCVCSLWVACRVFAPAPKVKLQEAMCPKAFEDPLYKCSNPGLFELARLPVGQELLMGGASVPTNAEMPGLAAVVMEAKSAEQVMRE